MQLDTNKKLEYIHHVLVEVMNGGIETEDSVLLEIALMFIENMQKESVKDSV